MKIKDAMHNGVSWVEPNTPIPQIAKIMRENNIGAVPVGEKIGRAHV